MRQIEALIIVTSLLTKLSRPGDPEKNLLVFESSCYLPTCLSYIVKHFTLSLLNLKQDAVNFNFFCLIFFVRQNFYIWPDRETNPSLQFSSRRSDWYSCRQYVFKKILLVRMSPILYFYYG